VVNVETRQAQAVAQLTQTCDVMATLASRYNPVILEPKAPEQYFEIMVSSVIGQQLSVKAASTIESRVVGLLGDITPDAVLATTPEALREVGLSRSKGTYIYGIAEAFEAGVIDPFVLSQQEEAAIISQLTALKGIGPWTAEMFLIFAMGREDIWSPGDLGLKKAVEAHFGEGVNTTDIASRWAPYRSYAALYLWEFIDQKK